MQLVCPLSFIRLSLVPFPPFPTTHTHTPHTVLLTSPPIFCPSNVSQAYDMTALSAAIIFDKKGNKGCAECAAVLRAAGAQEAPDVLLKMCSEKDDNSDPVKPDMNKFNALIKAGAPIRTTVRRN